MDTLTQRTDHDMTPQAYASMTVTREARDALQRLALTHSARVGRRLSMAGVLLAVVKVAQAHPEELAHALDNHPTDGAGQ